MNANRLSPLAFVSALTAAQFAALFAPVSGAAGYTGIVAAVLARLAIALAALPVCVLARRYADAGAAVGIPVKKRGHDALDPPDPDAEYDDTDYNDAEAVPAPKPARSAPGGRKPDTVPAPPTDRLSLIGKAAVSAVGVFYALALLAGFALALGELYAYAQYDNLPFAALLTPVAALAAIIAGRGGAIPVARAAFLVAVLCAVGLLTSLAFTATAVEPLRVTPLTAEGFGSAFLREAGAPDALLIPPLLVRVSRHPSGRGSTVSLLAAAVIGAAIVFLTRFFADGALGAFDVPYPFAAALSGVGIYPFTWWIAAALRLALYTALVRDVAAKLLPSRATSPVWYTAVIVAALLGFASAAFPAIADMPTMVYATGLPALVGLLLLPGAVLLAARRRKGSA